MMMTRGWMTVALLLLPACGGGEAPQADAPAAADSAPSAAVAAPAAGQAPPAGVTASVPAVQEGRAAAAQDTGYTAWAPLQMPSEPWVQEAATPDALLGQVRDVVAAQLEEPDAGVLPTRMQSQGADAAVGLLTHPNLADDSIRDIEFRIHMRPAGSVWRVTAVDRRERCRRGVGEGGRCA
jgi:hypothetical protein